MNLRAIAAYIILQVVTGRSLADCLPDEVAKIPDARDQGFLQALCYGVCRWYFRLVALADLLLEKPLKEKDQDIYMLLLVGLYQLIEMRVPAHAAVAETVAATKYFKKIWAKGLVNAVLRNYQRRELELNKEVKMKIEDNPQAFFSHPLWLIEQLQKDWPSIWQEILIANNQHPPFALRVNQKRVTREAYLKKLISSADQISARIIPETSAGIFLEKPVDVNQLIGFNQGEISVQDGAAQLAAEILEITPNLRVLDACAAPGGKTAHILELQSNVELVAVDRDVARLQLVRDNLQRLHLSANCLSADVADVRQWWDGKLFDRILLDAPCSASGVIRRHPDIKLLRRADDLEKLAKEQLRLLTAIWDLLKPDGLLVYATCSIFSIENVDVLQAFLATHGSAREEKIKANWGIECTIGRQIFPGTHDMDGFYYARLKKNI